MHMKTFFRFRILMAFVIVAAILGSCSKDDDSDNGNGAETPAGVTMQDAALTGIVRDTDGDPLSGVRVITGTLTATIFN